MNRPKHVLPVPPLSTPDQRMGGVAIHRKIISDEAGVWAWPFRAVLRGAATVYAVGVALRNRRYDRRGPMHALPLPVISVGNITAGGTGKTPLVIDLVDRLRRLGRTPAVIARGYGAGSDGPNDEERLIRRRCRDVIYVANPDRIAAARTAHHDFGADVIVLDDGFQHRRLGRTLDIVSIDATCPFGYGHLLPRGLLREPLRSLCRADVVILTRCDQASPTELSRISDRLVDLAPQAVHLQCNHRVTAVETLDGTSWDGELTNRRAILLASIGNPKSFAATARALGVEVVAERWFPDHHVYRERDIRALLRLGQTQNCDLLLTTEKDAVKLVGLPGVDKADIRVVRISIDFTGQGGTILDTALERTLSKSATHDATVQAG